eukprot:gnl/MRDRNA2_/MRDRNA2_376557_c0_seq1.p1 gnl/MRDRNA2_/MRDRNA2_376557_c0~~gnl/MRDRNA2_/MRDRNA2_376557_c0_seq1.p1  ORF type:complete len:161 (-),score=28.57 gnl/MRDRNA2_/MRDRNA2_376557_c0_seq1:33-515(-)
MSMEGDEGDHNFLNVQMTLEVWRLYIQKPDVQAAFRKIGLFVHNGNADALFSLLDFDNSGSVDIDEFVEGCTQLVGSASQLDIARLHHEVRSVLMEVHDLQHHLLGTEKKELKALSRCSYASACSASSKRASKHRSRLVKSKTREARESMKSIVTVKENS